MEITQHLLKNEVPDLRSSMGVGYHHAVQVCLERFGVQREYFDREEVWDIFEKEVRGVLAKGLAILT
jgi:hypothetical protein